MTGLDARPFFLPSLGGALFAIYHPPRLPARANVLFVSPFGEELNKSRRMLAQTARRLAAQGTGVLLFDFFGCGDSDGEFGEARWTIWQQNIRDAWRWLQAQNKAPCGVMGVRLGAAMAAQFSVEQAVDRLLLWQPVIKGQVFLTQFLRLRTAATMLSTEENKQTPTQLRHLLAQGGSLEIAGYSLHPEVALAMDALDLGLLRGMQVKKILLFELSSLPGKALSMPVQACIQAWAEQGLTVASAVVQGDSFWATQEISTSPALIDRTCVEFA